MSKKDESFYYDLVDFEKDVPDLQDTDLANLEMFYPSYGERWRPEIIKGIREGKSHYQIVEAKLKAMDAESKKQESYDGLKGNISYKLRRAAFRVIYLRYRKHGHSRNKSGRLARQSHFPKITAEHFRVNTRGCSLDKDEE